MKKHLSLQNILLLLAVALIGFTSMKNQDDAPENYVFEQVTVVESVVPGGLGRSRMITSDKKGDLEEIKLKNFFSLAGINFKNIKENDKSITNKISEMTDQGWELYDVTSGVYSQGGGGLNGGGGTGIFITRYLFKKKAE